MTAGGPPAPGPLDGVRVLTIATMLGAGHCTALLADFGAQVVAVEMPERGDSLRQLGPFSSGRSLRWAVLARNKQSITVDLHRPEGQQVIRDLAAVCDVVVENYRPGTVDRWGIGWEALSAVNPRIVMLSLSGYGQTGPSRHKPGFGRVIEAASGIMHVTGDADGPPTQIGVPLVDYVAGTVGAMSVAMALHERDRPGGSGRGQWIDLSLYETMVRLSDAALSAYSATGQAPRRTGNRYPNIAPSDVYRTRDGGYVFHSSATQTVFVRLMQAIGRPELVADPRFARNSDRVQHNDEINDIVQAWFDEHDLATAVELLEAADVPVGPVNSMAEVAADEQLLQRASVVPLDVPAVGPVLVPGLVPKFSRTPGRIEHAGPELGADTERVLQDLLGYGPEQVQRLRDDGAV